MKTPIPEGYLVAIEGIDGAGKTSVSTAIAQWCGERGLLSLFSKEPTGVDYGATLRQSAAKGRLSLDDELDLFLLDRQGHVTRAIQPALSSSAIVVLDRYYWSTAAYQGARGADPTAILEANEKFAPKPDLVILLDLPVALGIERIRARGDEPNAFEKTKALNRSRSIFLELANHDPSCKVVDATMPMREVVSIALNHFRHSAIEKIVSGAKAKFGAITPQHVEEGLMIFGGTPLGGSAELVVA